MNKSILIVDDDPQMRLALKHILLREGYDVTEAGDGDAALKAIARAAFDLVIMDLIMPGKEGIETIMELRKTRPKLKIIAMSGGSRLDMTDSLGIARHCGASYILSKPFEPAYFKKIVSQCWAES